LELSDTPFVLEDSVVKDGYRYYVASGVHYCNQLTFEVLHDRTAKVNLSADVVALGKAKTNVSVDAAGQVRVRSDKKLAYGVELKEITYNDKRKRL
jgi:hypothetical protein